MILGFHCMLCRSSHLYGHTVVKVLDLTAHPPDYVRFRANGSHQLVAADRTVEILYEGCVAFGAFR